MDAGPVSRLRIARQVARRDLSSSCSRDVREALGRTGLSVAEPQLWQVADDGTPRLRQMVFPVARYSESTPEAISSALSAAGFTSLPRLGGGAARIVWLRGDTAHR